MLIVAVATPKVNVGVAGRTRAALNENWVICDQLSY